VELYPPVINLLDYLSKDDHFNIELISTRNNKKWLSKYTNVKIKITRINFLNQSKLHKIGSYFVFYLYTLIRLIQINPCCTIYFDTYSSLSALLFKKYFSKSNRIYCHYHELLLYHDCVGVLKYIANFEKRNIGLLFWLSQTNEERLRIFLDYNKINVDLNKYHVVANYPPKNWQCSTREPKSLISNIKLVYLGAIGYETMYLKEVCDFVSANIDFSIDFYSNMIDPLAIAFFKNNQNDRINLKGGVDYKEIPGILKEYDIGVIMYKPFSVNTVQAVSNKMFEYLVCGLDVLCSEDMLYSKKYERTDCRPFVQLVDFSDLPRSIPDVIRRCREGDYRPVEFLCEEEFSKIFVSLKN